MAVLWQYILLRPYATALAIGGAASQAIIGAMNTGTVLLTHYSYPARQVESGSWIKPGNPESWRGYRAALLTVSGTTLGYKIFGHVYFAQRRANHPAVVGGENTQTNIARNDLIGYFNWCFGQKVAGRAGLPQTTAISPVAWWAIWAAILASRRPAAGALERRGPHRRAPRLMFRLLPERSEALATETVGWPVQLSW